MFIRIYALAVCFATILCITISTGIGLFDIVQMVLPKLTMNSYEYRNLQSNENFRRSGMTGAWPALMAINERGPGAALARPVPKQGEQEPLSEEEVTRMREQQLAIIIDNARHDAQRSLIQIMIVLLVSCPVFYFHWRLAQKLDSADQT